MPRALIVGFRGQDGAYLSELLSCKGYEVFGAGRAGSVPLDFGQRTFTLDFANRRDVANLLEVVGPDEIYYLAAFHHSSEAPPLAAGELLARSFEVNTLGLLHWLDAIHAAAQGCRLFYAASSRIFGNADKPLQDEQTPLNPLCPYGISKAAAVNLCRYYRNSFGLNCSCGILYNHESPKRPPAFVSRKIVMAAAQISKGDRTELVLGNLDALVDWGSAVDYVRAMWAILQLPVASDFVIASGAVHSVRDFVETAFEYVGLDWRKYVKVRTDILAPDRPANTLRGDTSKLRIATGWRPEIDFRALVHGMVAAELA